VKYVILKAAQIAGIELGNDFNTIEAKNFLKKLGFEIIREKWDFGSQLLEQSSKLFLEYAQLEGVPVSPDQFGIFSKGFTRVYYQLKLPKPIFKNFSIGNKIHFEWLAFLKEDSAIFSVGFHIEFPNEEKEVNRKLGDALLERVNLTSLEEKINTKVEREDHKVYTWIVAKRTLEDPEDHKEEIIEWMARSMVNFYRTFLPALEEVLPSGLDGHDQQYWIEIAAPPTIEYVGKFVWAPKGVRWRKLKEVKEGDVIYHYITSKGPKEYRGKFVGKSRVKGSPRIVNKEELKRLLQSVVSSWDEEYADFTSKWFSEYEEFYVVELTEFNAFEQPVSSEEIEFKAPQSYLIKAPLDVIEKLESIILPSGILGKIDHLLKRKGQIILYGPPGTGKTWVAIKYVKSKVPNQAYHFGKGSTLRDGIKYYILVMSTAKYNPNRIQEGLEETFSGRLQQAFEEIEEGDLAFIYLTQPFKKIIALAKCIGKTEEGAKFRILKRVNGPTYEKMKSEEPMKDSLAVRTMLRGTLFPISYGQALWMASKIGFDNLEPLDILSVGSTREFKVFDFVTFHPAFSYEDFVEGIKPETYEDPETGKKELLFKIEEGVFKKMARNAYNALLAWAGIQKEWAENSSIPVLSEKERKLITTKLKTEPESIPKVYLIIDEINRGDIPKIFGELITLLETDKRLFMDNETSPSIPYSKKTFGIPPNLYIIGTMNTSDRSIALIDVALRRRFGFIEVMPDYDLIREHIIDKANENVKPTAEVALKALKTLNRRIRQEYDRDHQIGHSYYLRLQEHLEDGNEFLEELKMIWFHEILPLLQEYFYDSPEKLKRVLKSKDSQVLFLKIDDSEDIVEFMSKDEFDNENFLQALKSLIEADETESE